MGWNVSLCKKMCPGRARKPAASCPIGHQRHYSMLYAHATEILKNDVLGDVKSHPRPRGTATTPGPTCRADKDKANLVKEVVQPFYRDGWFNPVFHEDYDALKDKIKNYGYDNVEELVRWRLPQRNGRRPDGGAGQPPARRLQHLPRPHPSACRHRRRRQILLRQAAVRRRNQRLRLQNQLERPRLRRSRLAHLRVSRQEPSARPGPPGRHARQRPERHRRSSPIRRSTPTASRRTANA